MISGAKEKNIKNQALNGTWTHDCSSTKPWNHLGSDLKTRMQIHPASCMKFKSTLWTDIFTMLDLALNLRGGFPGEREVDLSLRGPYS